MKVLAEQRRVQQRIDDILEKVRQRPKVWTEEEVLEAAYDPSHLSTDQLFDYCEGKADATARAEVEAHAARCDFCLHQLAELGRLVPPPYPIPSMLVQLLPILQRLPESAFPRLAWTPEPVRVGAGAFADAIPYQEFVSEDGQLTVIIQPDGEAAPGGAVLAVEVEDATWVGGKVLVTLTNEEGTQVLLSERLAMEKRGDDLWEGSLPLTPERAGPLTEKVYMLAMREEPEL